MEIAGRVVRSGFSYSSDESPVPGDADVARLGNSDDRRSRSDVGSERRIRRGRWRNDGRHVWKRRIRIGL